MELEGVELVNLTPHELVIYFDLNMEADGAFMWKSQGVARVSEISTEGPWLKAHLEGSKGLRNDRSYVTFPSVVKSYSSVEYLPEPKEGTIYVVSLVVLQALAGSRPDCFAPDSGPDSAIRDKAGKILGVRRLMQLS